MCVTYIYLKKFRNESLIKTHLFLLYTIYENIVIKKSQDGKKIRWKHARNGIETYHIV